MEYEHQNGTRNGLTIVTNTNSGEENYAADRNSSSPSSSSSGSPFELDVTVNSRLSSDQVVSPGNDSGHGISGYETPPSRTSSSDNESPTLSSPPRQMMMEPPTGPTTPSGYRIPSSVFAGSKSPSPMDWSVASNESLFSIHMGNMSFTGDHQHWFGDPAMSPMMDFSTPRGKTTEKGPQNKDVGASYGVTESKAAETMREVIKENEADRADREKKEARRSNFAASFSRSDVGEVSVNSFAFPILTDNHGDLSPVKQKGSAHPLAIQENPSLAKEQHDEQQKTQTETDKPPQNNNASQCKWLSCFPCCSSSF